MVWDSELVIGRGISPAASGQHTKKQRLISCRFFSYCSESHSFSRSSSSRSACISASLADSAAAACSSATSLACSCSRASSDKIIILGYEKQSKLQKIKRRIELERLNVKTKGKSKKEKVEDCLLALILYCQDRSPFYCGQDLFVQNSCWGPP